MDRLAPCQRQPRGLTPSRTAPPALRTVLASASRRDTLDAVAAGPRLVRAAGYAVQRRPVVMACPGKDCHLYNAGLAGLKYARMHRGAAQVGVIRVEPRAIDWSRCFTGNLEEECLV